MISVLRTADAWWVLTPEGTAARVESDATTTGALLAEPGIRRIEAAAALVDGSVVDAAAALASGFSQDPLNGNFAEEIGNTFRGLRAWEGTGLKDTPENRRLE